MPEPDPVLLYDGVCALCNWAVRLVLRLDRRRAFRFAALASPAARSLLAPHPEFAAIDSIVLIEGKRASVRSTALLRILRRLGWPWKAFLIGYLVPREIRDSLYDVVAYWRYRFAGRYDACPVPPPEVRSRFIDQAGAAAS